MITIIKRKDRSYHCGYRHTLADFDRYCLNGENFTIVEARSRKHITYNTLLSLLHTKEKNTGDVQLLTRAILAGGLVAYFILLEKMVEIKEIKDPANRPQ